MESNLLDPLVRKTCTSCKQFQPRTKEDGAKMRPWNTALWPFVAWCSILGIARATANQERKENYCRRRCYSLSFDSLKPAGKWRDVRRPDTSSRDISSLDISYQRLFLVGKWSPRKKKFDGGLFVAVLMMRQHLDLYHASQRSTKKLNTDFNDVKSLSRPAGCGLLTPAMGIAP